MSIIYWSIIWLLAILWIILVLFPSKRIIKFARQNIGSQFYPFVGNAYLFIGKDTFEIMEDLVKRHSLPCNLWIQHDYSYVTDVPSEVKIALISFKSVNKANIYDIFRVPFGNSLLASDYSIWRPRRKLFSKSFSWFHLRSFLETFNKKSQIFVDLLKKQTPEDNILENLKKLTMDTLLATLVGVDMDLQIKHCSFVDWTSEIQDQSHRRLLEYYLPFKIWKLTPAGQRLQQLQKLSKQFIREIVLRELRQNAKKTDKAFQNETLFFNSVLFAEDVKLDCKDIFEEVYLFIAGASETTTYTLINVLILLAMNPDVQKLVHDEISKIINYNVVSEEHLAQLKYTERVLLESMRLLPATPFIGRHVTADLDLGTKVVPTGANIVASIYHMHRNEKYWRDPLKFDPDRFLPEEMSRLDSNAYAPFSLGPRNCIGRSYAMNLMKVVICYIVKDFELHTCYKNISELHFTACVTLKLKQKVDVSLIPRKSL